MRTIASLVLGLAGLSLLVSVGWRFASQKYSLPCPVWLRWAVELDNPFTKSNRATEVVRQLKLTAGMRVVDIGCGPGRLTIPIARQVGPQGEVVAVDAQAGMLRRVQQKAEAAKLQNVRLVQARAGEGASYGEDPLDRALLVTVLGEIPNQAAALKEIFDALKPGGILSVTEVIFDPHFQTHQSVVTLASAAGFREREFFGNRFAFTSHFERPQA